MPNTIFFLAKISSPVVKPIRARRPSRTVPITRPRRCPPAIHGPEHPVVQTVLALIAMDFTILRIFNIGVDTVHSGDFAVIVQMEAPYHFL